MDMLCIGNNLFDQEREMADIADAIERRDAGEALDPLAIGQSVERVRKRKALLG